MTLPRHRIGTSQADPDPLSDASDRVARAVAELREAVRLLVPVSGPTPNGSREAGLSQPALVPGGLVVLTEDNRGVSRAVAADLRSLGYPVVRVRHGVGATDVEGINLTGAAAVAAFLDRARSRGPLAAIVHAAPLRSVRPSGGPPRWDDPDDARALALLAQAGAADLTASVKLGGACLLVARPSWEDAQRGDDDRLARWVEILVRTLSGVRVRGLELDPASEPEVLAAEVVRAVLGTSDGPDRFPSKRSGMPESTVRGPQSEAILLGSPDLASWIHLAAALIDWLDDAPDVRLTDLAYTLHHEQPDYPFRVGLVATSGPDLSERLSGMIARLAVPSCRAIHDPKGAYWSGPEEVERPSSRLASPRGSWVHRLRGIGRGHSGGSQRGEVHVQGIPEWTGRDWLNHLVASRFSRGDSVRAERLLAGCPVRRLDLSVPPPKGPPPVIDPPMETATIIEAQPLFESLGVLDDVLDLRRQIFLDLLAGIEARGRFAG